MDIGTSATEYTQILVKLAPQGKCWPSEDSSIWVTMLDAFAQEFARVDASIVALIEEAFPNTTSVLLENWERVTGLPDECSVLGGSDAVRRADVFAKVRARGGQSAVYYEGILLALGYEGIVQDCAPYPADEMQAGMFLFDSVWPFYFLIAVYSAVADQTSFECKFNKIKPAHTIALFNYEA